MKDTALIEAMEGGLLDGPAEPPRVEVPPGLVYVTDVRAAGGKVTGIEIPAEVNAATTYPVAALTGSENADLAKAFVQFVLSDAAKAELTGAGFQSP